MWLRFSRDGAWKDRKKQKEEKLHNTTKSTNLSKGENRGKQTVITSMSIRVFKCSASNVFEYAMTASLRCHFENGCVPCVLFSMYEFSKTLLTKKSLSFIQWNVLVDRARFGRKMGRAPVPLYNCLEDRMEGANDAIGCHNEEKDV